MNIFKFAFIVWNLPTLAMSLNISLQTWKLMGYNYRTIEEEIKDYFEKKTYFLSVSIRLEYPTIWGMHIQHYLTNVLKQAEAMTFEIFVDHSGNERKTKVSYHNVWYVDSHDAFVALLPVIGKDFVEAMGQYMVIMEMAQNLQFEEEIQLIFQTAYQWNIIDITLASYVGGGIFNLYTYDIYRPQQCGQVVSRQFNAFVRGHLESKELFPHKLRDFHRCPLNIFIRPAPPFFSFSLTPDHKNIAHYEGLEPKILRTMANILNFEIRIDYWEDVELGSVLENGSVTGAFHLLRQRHVDIVVGYFHNPVRHRYFATSTPYYMTPQVMVISKRDKTSVDALWLLEPFHTRVWWLILFAVIVGMVCISLVDYNLSRPGGLTIHLTWLDMFGLALCNYRFYEFRYFSTNCGFIMWTFGFIIICASFGGKLYGAFHRQTIASPVTIAQLIKANYTFILKRYLTEDLVLDLQIPEQQIQVNRHITDDIILEAMLTDNRNLAVLTNYWQFEAFKAAHHHYGEYEMVPKALIVNHMCAFMRPQSYLLEPFNKLLRAFNSVGIFDKWMLDAARHYGIINEFPYDVAPEPKALSLAKFRVIFVGLLLLYGVALAAFIGEVIVKVMEPEEEIYI